MLRIVINEFREFVELDELTLHADIPCVPGEHVDGDILCELDGDGLRIAVIDVEIVREAVRSRRFGAQTRIDSCILACFASEPERIVEGQCALGNIERSDEAEIDDEECTEIAAHS